MIVAVILVVVTGAGTEAVIVAADVVAVGVVVVVAADRAAVRRNRIKAADAICPRPSTPPHRATAIRAVSIIAAGVQMIAVPSVARTVG
jgi:hypothetical protein